MAKAKVKLLLVDDEKAFVESLARRLCLRDFSVVCGSSGQEALDLLQTHRDIEVVLLDIKMPGMDGIATIRVIK